jgi:hypothetical protein
MEQNQSEFNINLNSRQSAKLQNEREILGRELRELKPTAISQAWRAALSITIAIISCVLDHPDMSTLTAVALAVACYIMFNFKRLLEVVLLSRKLSLVKKQIKSWDEVITDYTEAIKNESDVREK